MEPTRAARGAQRVQVLTERYWDAKLGRYTERYYGRYARGAKLIDCGHRHTSPLAARECALEQRGR